MVWQEISIREEILYLHPMKKSLLYITFAFANLLASCDNTEDIPVAGFDADKYLANIRERVTFTNTSMHATDYTWDFGDGISSWTENPEHLFNNPGIYTVQLIASNNNGSDTVTRNIEVVLPVEIFPGVGAAKIALTDTYESILNLYGDPDWQDAAYPDNGLTNFAKGWSETGLYCFFADVAGSSLDEDEKPEQILVQQPYRGVTSEKIGIGSRIADVFYNYGDPDTITNNNQVFEYKGTGIFFAMDDDSTILSISVFAGSGR